MKGFYFGSVESKKNPQTWTIEIELDLLNWSGSPTRGAVDLLKADALKTEISPSVNLVPNPYFARGLNYIGGYSNYRLWRGMKASLSVENPKFGEYCLKFPVRPFVMFSSAVISAEPGLYTVSMYVRSDTPGTWATLHMFNHTANKRFGAKRFPVTKEWKRIALTCRIPSVTALKFLFSVSSKSPEAVAYIDGLQMEKGDRATDFEASPATARLLTSAPDDFIRHGDPIHARLRLSTLKPNTSGKLTATVRDMFGEILAKKEHDFKFTSQEHPEIPLDLDGKIPDGVHTVQVDFDVNGKKYTEFSRFSVMPFFKNQHKHRKMFAPDYSGQECYIDTEPGLEELIRRWTRLGIGCNVHCPYPTRKLDEICRKYGFEYLDSFVIARSNPSPAGVNLIKRLFPGSDPQLGHSYYFSYFAESLEVLLQQRPLHGLLLDHRLSGGWTPEHRQKVVDTVASIVKKSSPRAIYCAGSEFASEIKDDPHYIDLILACREGVKKVYPQALFCEGGACNMTIGNGIREIDQMLTRLKGKMPIEIIQTHTYTHDVYAIEQNFKALIDVVENKHGLKGMKYYFGEGMHWGPYQILDWGLESINWDGKGWNTATPLSYDIGWREKLGAAWFMRSWLIFMTKINQVISSSSSMYARAGTFDVDVQMRPRVCQKIPNTLSMLLGNAKDFVNDVSFAKDIKCLIWEDEQGRPVAAVWNQAQEVDLGLKQGPWAKTDLPADVEIFDMMGAPRTFVKPGELPLSPFPVFLRGKPGEVKRYVKILSNASVIGDQSIPVKTNVELASRSQAKLTLTNLTAREENVSLTMNGKTENVKLKPHGEASFTSDLPVPVPFDKVVESGVRYTIESAGKEIASEAKFRGMAVMPFKGNWNEIPAIPMNIASGNMNISSEDFSAKAQMAWDKEIFRVRVTVRDDKFYHKMAKPEQRWNNDTFQVFIDTCCSARKKGIKVFDEDDYAYNIYPSEDGKSAQVFRWRSPDIQLTLGLAAPKDMTFADDIPCLFTRTETGYVYELTIPAKYMLPARLENNYCMGIALFLNDRDGEANVSNMLTTTAPGTSPYNKPYLYPQIILSEK